MSKTNYILLYHNYSKDDSDWVEKETLEEVNETINWYKKEYSEDAMEFKIIKPLEVEIYNARKE